MIVTQRRESTTYAGSGAPVAARCPDERSFLEEWFRIRSVKVFAEGSERLLKFKSSLQVADIRESRCFDFFEVGTANSLRSFSMNQFLALDDRAGRDVLPLLAATSQRLCEVT